jgi:hypothetical protein
MHNGRRSRASPHIQGAAGAALAGCGVTVTGMAIWVAVAVLVGLAQDFNLPRLTVSVQPRAVERVDAQKKDEQADDTDQHRNCRLISPRLRLCENPADRALKPPVLPAIDGHA